MTKTALRALTVAALSAAIALTTSTTAQAATEAQAPAPAPQVTACDPEAPYSTPECPNPWPDTTNVTVCMTEPELCDAARAADPVTPAPVTPAPVHLDPPPLAGGPADAGTAPAELDGEQLPTAQPVSTVPQPVAAPVFDWDAVWAQIAAQLAPLFRALG